jgi:hypothetical protein
MSIISFFKKIMTPSDDSNNPHQILIDKTIEFLKTDVKIIVLTFDGNLWYGTQRRPLKEWYAKGRMKIEFNLLKSNKIDRNNIDEFIPDRYILEYHGAEETGLQKYPWRLVFTNLSTGKVVDLNVSKRSVIELVAILGKVENILKNNLM